MEELCRFIDSVGHGVTINELHEMIREAGIYEHDNGTITEGEFFEFIRRTIVADLPSSKLPLIVESFERAVNTHLNTYEIGANFHAEVSERLCRARPPSRSALTDESSSIPGAPQRGAVGLGGWGGMGS